ncbi:hypothetical protein GCM10010393_11760 [Streptomyces gobitricini]|uniref:Uncharacterized protein n=1 Tax=Streptomyces gobitricini TaxID=68211 RepID=A0ABP5YSV4_9ACTN
MTLESHPQSAGTSTARPVPRSSEKRGVTLAPGLPGALAAFTNPVFLGEE